MTRSRALEGLAVLVTAWAFGYTIITGGDLWWHLAAGAEGMTRDAWSYTAHGARWLNHEWLADVILVHIGTPGVVYWKWAMIAATALLLFAALRRTAGFVPSYAATLFALATAAPFLDIRPHLWTLLAYAALLLLSALRLYAWLPLLFLAWANLHGGVVFGLGAVGIIQAFRAYRERSWTPALQTLACVVATLANPNGPAVLLYPFRYAFGGSAFRAGLMEWTGPFTPGGIQDPLYPWLIAASVAAVLVLRRRAVGPALVLSAVTLAMSLESRRFITLFAISAAPLVVEALAMIPIPSRVAAPAPWLALALGLFLLWPYPKTSAAFSALIQEESFPVDSLDFIEQNGLSGNLFVNYGWGGYVGFRTHGRMQVFIDGRADTVFPDAVYRQYLQVERLEPGWEHALDGAQYVLWPRTTALPARLVETGLWRVLHEDLVSSLLVRVGSEPATHEPAPSAYRELAAGGDALRDHAPMRAAGHFARALELRPDLRLACANLVAVQLRLNDRQTAAETAERCQGIYPDPQLLAMAQ